MLAPDPVKRSLNGYTYCENNPVDCVDPTGEVLNVLAGGIAGAVIGGVAGFAGSAVSQLISGQKFDSKKAWGAAANGAIVGGVKGALVSSGVGAGIALAADFAAGTLGSAAEQGISTGKVDVGRSVVSGLTNAVSGKIYGNSAIKSLGQAVGKGAAAGAATSGINYIYDALTSGNSSSQYGGDGLRRSYSSVTTIDPRGNCGTTNKLGLMTTTTSTYGYQYSSPQTEQRSNFSFGGFVANVATGAALGGLSSALFYGAGKAVEAVKNGVQNATNRTVATSLTADGVKSGSGSDNYVYRALNQKDYERYTNGLGLEAKNPNGSWSLKEHLVDGSGKLSWANDPYISTTSDLSVAKGFNQSGRGYGIVKIDINKVTSPSYKGYEIYPRVNGKEGLPYHYSVWQQETSVYQSIPSEAIVDFFN